MFQKRIGFLAAALLLGAAAIPSTVQAQAQPAQPGQPGQPGGNGGNGGGRAQYMQQMNDRIKTAARIERR